MNQNNNKKVMMGLVVMTLMMAMGAQGLLDPVLGTSSDPLLKLDLNLCLIKSVGQFKTFCAEDFLSLADLKAYLTASFPSCFPNGIFLGNPLGVNVHLTALDLVDVYLDGGPSAQQAASARYWSASAPAAY